MSTDTGYCMSTDTGHCMSTDTGHCMSTDQRPLYSPSSVWYCSMFD